MLLIDRLHPPYRCVCMRRKRSAIDIHTCSSLTRAALPLPRRALLLVRVACTRYASLQIVLAPCRNPANFTSSPALVEVLERWCCRDVAPESSFERPRSLEQDTARVQTSPHEDAQQPVSHAPFEVDPPSPRSAKLVFDMPQLATNRTRGVRLPLHG